MIKRAQAYFASIPAVFIDGLLYVWIGMLGSITAVFSSDDVAKYVGPQLLFWLKSGFAVLSGALVNIKMFRSTAFAEHQAEKKKTSDTQSFVK